MIHSEQTSFELLCSPIATYIDSTDQPTLDLMDISPIASEEFRYLR